MGNSVKENGYEFQFFYGEFGHSLFPNFPKVTKFDFVLKGTNNGYEF